MEDKIIVFQILVDSGVARNFVRVYNRLLQILRLVSPFFFFLLLLLLLFVSLFVFVFVFVFSSSSGEIYFFRAQNAPI